MKLIVLMLCSLGMTTSAMAQYGVSNARDGNGNLVRNSGMNSARSYDQPPVNNFKSTPAAPVVPAPVVRRPAKSADK